MANSETKVKKKGAEQLAFEAAFIKGWEWRGAFVDDGEGNDPLKHAEIAWLARPPKPPKVEKGYVEYPPDDPRAKFNTLPLLPEMFPEK